VTLLQKLCIQGIIDTFWLAFQGVNHMSQGTPPALPQFRGLFGQTKHAFSRLVG